MALDLLKRGEKGSALTATEHDDNFDAIETEVNAKADATHTHSAADTTTGTFADGRISQSSVTQHQAALSLTESQISDLSHDAVSLRGVALDASVGTPSDGDILVFRSLGSDWILEAKPAGASPNFNDLGDVTITTVADGEIVAFDNATGEWINRTLSEAGIAAEIHEHLLADITDAGALAALDTLAIQDLSNVTITSVTNNEVLAFDAGTGDWINQTPAEAGLATSAQGALADSALQPADIATGTITPRADDLDLSGGTDGQVLTVQLDGSAAFEDASAHTHVVADITDAGALASLNTVGSAEIDADAVGPSQLAPTTVTAGSFTNADITVDDEGRITAASSGTGGSGGLTTSLDGGTAITVGSTTDGEHRILTAGTAITLTLDAQATVGIRSAFTPGGAGAVTVAVEAGAGFWLDGDNISGTIRTTSFTLEGYGYFECIRNTDSNSAEWVFVGKSDHAQVFNANVDAQSNELQNAVLTGGSLGDAFDAADQQITTPELKDYAETSPTPSSSAGTLTLDLTTGNVFETTLTENTTIAFSNPPASGKAGSVFLIAKQDATGSRTLTFPASVLWPGGTAPTISTAANAIDILTFVTRDGGTTWYGFEGGIGFA